MPPIHKAFLYCSVYFYPSEQAAKDGESLGGSGFLVNVPAEGHEAWTNHYVITNKHVLDSGGLYMRFATNDGQGVDVIETERDSWIDHPKGYDVSALEADLNWNSLRFSSIPINRFMTRDLLEDWQIATGDETFLVGRLITPWGQQRNNPAVRFGNISMMADPNEPIIGWGNVQQEAFLVECRSLSGFSGSPVFCTTTRTYSWEEKMPRALQKYERYTKNFKWEIPSPFGTFGPWLLGIDMSHLPLWKPVYDSKNLNEPKPNHWVEQNTGIACVLPAWHVLDLLNDEEFVKEREKGKKELDKKKKQSAIPDVADGDEIPPLTRSGFDEVLRRVSSKISESESEKSED